MKVDIEIVSARWPVAGSSARKEAWTTSSASMISK